MGLASHGRAVVLRAFALSLAIAAAGCGSILDPCTVCCICPATLGPDCYDLVLEPICTSGTSSGAASVLAASREPAPIERAAPRRAPGAVRY